MLFAPSTIRSKKEQIQKIVDNISPNELVEAIHPTEFSINH